MKHYIVNYKVNIDGHVYGVYEWEAFENSEQAAREAFESINQNAEIVSIDEYTLED